MEEVSGAREIIELVTLVTPISTLHKALKLLRPMLEEFPDIMP
jgi:ribosomal protein S7